MQPRTQLRPAHVLRHHAEIAQLCARLRAFIGGMTFARAHGMQTPAVVTPPTISKTPLRALIERERAQRRRNVRWIALGVALVAACGLALGLALRPRPVPLSQRFRALPITRGDVLRDVVATGHLEAVTTVQVGAEISGRIASVEVDYNDRVRSALRYE